MRRVMLSEVRIVKYFLGGIPNHGCEYFGTDQGIPC